MNDKPIYRMSAAGKCPRALSAIRLEKEEKPAPEWLERVANEGNWHEERIKKQLWTEQRIFIDHEQEEFTLEYPTFRLVGHVDGWAKFEIEDGQAIEIKLLEIKSMSQYEFDRWMKGRWKAFPQYADQLTCYMEATGLGQALYVVKNRSSGYIDQFVQKSAPSDINTIITKLTEVENYVGRGLLYPAEYDPTSIECRRCEFRDTLCLTTMPAIEAATYTELAEATKMWRRGKALEAEAAPLIEEGKKILEAHCEAMGVPKFTIEGMLVNRYQVHSVTYPKKELESTVPEELLAQVCKVEDRWQCRITDLQAKE